jgi:hypothetical protein
MNHHPHLEDPLVNRVGHHYRVPAVAAVRGNLKAVGVLEHHYIMCQHNAYLVVAVVATLAAAAILDCNYQQAVLHSFAVVGIPVADSHEGPVGYLDIRRQGRMRPG